MQSRQCAVPLKLPPRLGVGLESGVYRDNFPAQSPVIAREAIHSRLEAVCLQGLKDGFQRPAIKFGALANKVVILFNDRQKLQAEMACRRFDAKTQIRHATGHESGNRGMRQFGTGLAVYLIRVHAVFVQ